MLVCRSTWVGTSAGPTCYGYRVRPFAAVVLALTSLGPVRADAFRDAPLGTAIRQRTMPVLDGRRASLLADGKVSVFVFIRSAQENTELAMRQLARLEVELAAKPVRFVAIVAESDREEIRSVVNATGVRMPVLVDEADALYGELGVALHPCAGIVGKDHRLTGYQPFRKINFLDAMRGQIQVALGELDAAGLARVLDPGVQVAPSGGRSRARLRLARTLLSVGSVDAAIESARAGVALEPDLADGHQLLAEALAKRGSCDEAARESQAARRLAPDAPAAAPACASR